MKIATKILNFIIYALVILGIVFVFYYFFVIKPQKVYYQELLQKNQRLIEQIESNNKSLRILKDSITVKDAEIDWSKEKIYNQSLYIKGLEQKLEEDIAVLNNFTLEEALQYILEYYHTDKARIITYDDSIYVAIEPLLMHEWTNTIARLESRNVEVSVYEKQVSDYDCLITQYEDKISFMERRDSLLRNSLELTDKKNLTLQELVDDRNRKIKSIRFQRNALGVITGVVIILALL